MAGYHAIIGIAEGGLTAGVLSFLGRVRPDLIRPGSELRLGIADWTGGLLLVAVPVVILALAGSSTLPDPLQGLLEAVPDRSDTDTLLSPVRYRDYAEQTAVFGLLIVLAYITSRLAPRWRRKP
jgi:hypothetical protein